MNKILFIDIETFANTARAWSGRMYEVNLIKIVKEGGMASFAYKWAGKNTVHCVTREGQRNDKALVKELKRVISQADIVVFQNGKSFDAKHWNARMWKHEITPPRPYKVVDTMVEAKKYFKLDSYSLDNIAKFLGIPGKLKHRGFDMWEECEQDIPKAWKEMAKYNKRDIVVMEQVYYRMLPWIKGHPPVSDKPASCPKCGGHRLQARGIRNNIARYMCRGCWGWCSASLTRRGEGKLKSA